MCSWYRYVKFFFLCDAKHKIISPRRYSHKKKTNSFKEYIGPNKSIISHREVRKPYTGDKGKPLSGPPLGIDSDVLHKYSTDSALENAYLFNISACLLYLLYKSCRFIFFLSSLCTYRLSRCFYLFFFKDGYRQCWKKMSYVCITTTLFFLITLTILRI